ncbi:hypothetical protein Y032_0020g66 [Ancylostoma ceylanicum]|uniref:Transthyretin-like family protein n=1 Tax=Ancylostoma ceylanicum TaxID=53326 RepID=A0A016V3C3_9BILA|nr:hypothetical protein Y032_0020g66 [Ancylostoma ceylanicum]
MSVWLLLLFTCYDLEIASLLSGNVCYQLPAIDFTALNKMLRVSLDTVIFLFLAVFHTTAAVKSIAAKGNLTCDEYPAGQILVRLFKVDEDSIEFLEQTHTDEAGCFELVGRSRSDSIWRPVLNIYHDCDDAKNPGRRKMNFLLPRKYVTDGDTPERVFDLGTWNLQTSVKEDEERVDKITRRRRRNGGKQKSKAHNSTLDRYENPDDRVDPW